MSARNKLILLLATVAFAVVGICIGLQKSRERQIVESENRRNEWIADQKHALQSGQHNLIFYSTHRTDELMAAFAGMPEIESIEFELTDLSDAGFRHVADLPNLKELMLYGGARPIGNESLQLLHSHPKLQKLTLINTNVTDAGLDVLLTLPELVELELYRDLHKNTLTDVAVERLRKMKNLRKLVISGGWMSGEALSELRDTLPDCSIETESRH